MALGSPEYISSSGISGTGVQATALGSSVSVDGRASFGYSGWNNVQSPYSISSLTISSS
jgi:hypothetical protein